MECKLTHVAPPFRLNGGNRQMVNVTDECCAATITTRYGAIGPTNTLTSVGKDNMVLITYD